MFYMPKSVTSLSRQRSKSSRSVANSPPLVEVLRENVTARSDLLVDELELSKDACVQTEFDDIDEEEQSQSYQDLGEVDKRCKDSPATERQKVNLDEHHNWHVGMEGAGKSGSAVLMEDPATRKQDLSQAGMSKVETQPDKSLSAIPGVETKKQDQSGVALDKLKTRPYGSLSATPDIQTNAHDQSELAMEEEETQPDGSLSATPDTETNKQDQSEAALEEVETQPDGSLSATPDMETNAQDQSIVALEVVETQLDRSLSATPDTETNAQDQSEVALEEMETQPDGSLSAAPNMETNAQYQSGVAFEEVETHSDGSFSATPDTDTNEQDQSEIALDKIKTRPDKELSATPHPEANEKDQSGVALEEVKTQHDASLSATPDMETNAQDQSELALEDVATQPDGSLSAAPDMKTNEQDQSQVALDEIETRPDKLLSATPHPETNAQDQSEVVLEKVEIWPDGTLSATPHTETNAKDQSMVALKEVETQSDGSSGNNKSATTHPETNAQDQSQIEMRESEKHQDMFLSSTTDGEKNEHVTPISGCGDVYEAEHVRSMSVTRYVSANEQDQSQVGDGEFDRRTNVTVRIRRKSTESAVAGKSPADDDNDQFRAFLTRAAWPSDEGKENDSRQVSLKCAVSPTRPFWAISCLPFQEPTPSHYPFETPPTSASYVSPSPLQCTETCGYLEPADPNSPLRPRAHLSGSGGDDGGGGSDTDVEATSGFRCQEVPEVAKMGRSRGRKDGRGGVDKKKAARSKRLTCSVRFATLQSKHLYFFAELFLSLPRVKKEASCGRDGLIY